MSFDFNILWLEDNKKWTKSQENLLRKWFQNENLILKIRAETEIDEFLEILEKKANPRKFHKYDLILVDYNLSSTLTGDQLILRLREKKVYADILFYSSQDEKAMRDKIQEATEPEKEAYEGTYVANRRNYKVKLFKLVNKNIQRRNSVVDLRGLLMDTTAEYDFIMKESVCVLYDELNLDDKKSINTQIENAIDSAKDKSNRNFTDIGKALGKDKIEAIFNSIYYTMDVKDKYEILQEILEKKEIESFKSFPLKHYNSKVITHRNKLAHKKIDIAECYQYLLCYDKLKELKVSNCATCDEYNTNKDLCDQDTKKYSCDKCQEIRTDLFQYWEKFQDLFKKVSQS